MLVKKEVIRPGTFWYQDQTTGLPKKLVVTDDTVKHFHDSGKEMLSTGLSIPVPFEHQPEANALTPAEKAAKQLKENAGWIAGYELGDVVEEGKTVKNVLFANVDIQDPEVAKKLPRTIRYTSPWINSFTDGNGKEWNGVISHLALTTRPRITKQQPFPSVAAAMSFAHNLANEAFDPKKCKGLALSRAGLLDGDKPVYPMAFSLLTGVHLAQEEMPKKEEKHEEKPKVGPAKGESAAEGAEEEGNIEEIPGGGEAELEETVNPEEMGAEEAVADAKGDIPICDVVCKLLEATGVEIPEGTCEDNFFERMYVLLFDKIKGESQEEEMEKVDPAATNPPPGTPPVVQEQPPLYMSLETIEKIVDPNVRQALKISLSLQNAVLEQAKVARQQRIERLAKNVRSQPFTDKLVAMSANCKLSLSTDGKVVDEMAGWLDAMEMGIKNLPQLLTTSSANIVELSHPRQYDGDSGEVAPERASQLVDEICLRNGLKK